MLLPRSPLVYRLIAVVWAVILVWQVLEHQRVKELARTATVRRARDIANTMDLVIRSQRRFGSIVSKPRLESALKELLKSDDLRSIALLNAGGEVVVSAGEALDGEHLKRLPQGTIHWDEQSVTVVNLMDLGTNVFPEGAGPAPAIVLPDPERDPRREGRRFPPPGPRPEGGTNAAPSNPPPGPGGEGGERRPDDWPRPPMPPPREGPGTNLAALGPGGTNPPGAGPGDRAARRRPGFWRPPWMNETEYKALIQEKGLHALALVLSRSAYDTAWRHDLWMRLMIIGFAAVGVVGFGLAWRNLVKSSEFQMRLVRASELNTHLREMNIAAAGLAHETRNPLNTIRVMAQIVSKGAEASPETRQKAIEIVDRVDYVVAQLNEFINYSKPRELRRAPVALDTVITEVVGALRSDLEDKAIHLETSAEKLTVSADQQLLRQVVFNLLLNAIQAVEAQGQVQITAAKADSGQVSFAVSDNGPGVPPEQREEIFRPYFTTREKGTGLGLAVVKQIVLLHGWEIQYLPNDGRGAVFRVSGLELAASHPA